MALSLVLFYHCILLPVHRNILHTTLAPFTRWEFVLFVLSVIFVAAAGNIINDYYDFELDKRSKPNRPLPSGAISLDWAIYLHAFFLFTGIAAGFYLGWTVSNYKIGYIYIVCALLLLGYSIYLKKIPLAGNLLVSGLIAFILVLLLFFDAAYLKMIHAARLFEGTSYALNILLWQLRFYAGFAFLSNLAREIIKDIEDREGDAAMDINTFAVAYGEGWAKALAAVCLVLLIAGLGYFAYNFSLAKAWLEAVYLGFLLIVPVLLVLLLLWRAHSPKNYHQLSIMLKLIMLVGILSMPVFYYFSKPFA